MKPWLRRTLGLLPIVGGGAGLAVLTTVIAGQQDLNALGAIILVTFALLYLVGIVAGLWMLEDHRHAVALNLVFWALQVPQLISPVMTYVFWAPANIGVWWNMTTSQSGFAYQVGSTFQFDLLNIGSNVAVALNAFALVCMLYLCVLYRRQYPAIEPEVVEDVATLPAADQMSP
ncbi:hypothetical protein [Pseudoxanthomonas sp. UTMC 1351]|uniref:hypothetical protein n=1 Tax=Pseudoxanthomonas sp. UTMC 1351 TaxID=2695853 RepID=UPI0034CD25D5